MSKFTENHLSNLDLVLNSKLKQIREQLPTLADAFEKRTREELRRPVSLVLEQVESIRSSGRYSAEGTRTELRLAARGFTEQQLKKLRADTVEKLEAQRAARQEAVLTPKKPVTDPAQALVQEMQRQELRRELRTLDPLVLQTRMRLAATSEAGDLLRPFKKIEEIMNVRGVGEKSFLKIKDRLTVAAQK